MAEAIVHAPTHEATSRHKGRDGPFCRNPPGTRRPSARFQKGGSQSIMSGLAVGGEQGFRMANPTHVNGRLAVTSRRPAVGVRLMNDALRNDVQTLVEFVGLYCRRKHADSEALPVSMKGFDIKAIAGRPLRLCASCERLLKHALVKRVTCPLEPKPACKHCPQHCYHPAYRKRIREVMRFSGVRFALSGRLKYLAHLLF